MRKILLIFLILICSNANSSEIVKEVNAKSKIFIDGCGVPYGKFTFYSNGKSVETFTCPETKEIKKFNGVWEDGSSFFGLPKLDFIEIIYPSGIKKFIDFQKDTIRTTLADKGIEVQKLDFVYTDEEYNEKEKSKVVKKENENSKDLSGNAIDCYAKNTYEMLSANAKYPSGYKVNTHYYATIKFLTKTKVKLAIAIVSDEKTERTSDTPLSEKEFRILLPGDTFTYKVKEEAIVIKVTKNVKNLYDPYEHWKYLIDEKGEEIKIWRKTLDIFDPVITIRAMREGNRMKCKLVDYDDSSLFREYSKLNKILNNLLQKLKKKSESKNIL